MRSVLSGGTTDPVQSLVSAACLPVGMSDWSASGDHWSVTHNEKRRRLTSVMRPLKAQASSWPARAPPPPPSWLHKMNIYAAACKKELQHGAYLCALRLSVSAGEAQTLYP